MTGLNPSRRVLAFAAVAEAGTGLVLMIDPSRVAALLLGAHASGEAVLLGRVAGIALLALGVSCWPSRQHAERGSPAFRAMLIYNALIAVYLAWLGTVAHVGGALLWPAVVLHTLVALLLVPAWRGERRSKPSDH